MLNVTVRLIGWRLVPGEGPSWGSKPPCGPPKATRGWVGGCVCGPRGGRGLRSAAPSRYSRDRISVVGILLFSETYYAETMREKKTALKSVCENYENPQKVENSMKTNRIHTGILKIITRGQFLKPRQAEGITRNTIWELILPTGSS